MNPELTVEADSVWDDDLSFDLASDHELDVVVSRPSSRRPAIAPHDEDGEDASPMPRQEHIDDVVVEQSADGLRLDEPTGMEMFRTRLFGADDGNRETPTSRETRPQLDPDHLLETRSDAWYEPEPVAGFDVRRLIEEAPALLDMTLEIAPDVPRQCATCRSYRQYEQESRGWCTNNWAFTHRQMVNAGDLACDSTIGCWWLPTDEEVWLDNSEPVRGKTPRIDKLIAHLDPLEKVVGR